MTSTKANRYGIRNHTTNEPQTRLAKIPEPYNRQHGNKPLRGSTLNVSFIGGGVMAEAIISGMKKAGLDANITVSEPILQRASYLAETYDVTIARSNVNAVIEANLAVLSVKPQQLGDVANDIRQTVSRLHEITFMSIMAGVQSKTIIEQIDCDRLIRIMANTPSQVGLGATAWTTTPTVSDEMRDFCAKMLSSFGEQVYFEDEKLVDIATALSASGPAYVFVFIEALIDGAVELGMTNADARALAIQMVLGSAALAKETGKHPAELRNMVTSPGGTTAAALSALENANFRKATIDAVLAAYQRGEELAKLTDA